MRYTFKLGDEMIEIAPRRIAPELVLCIDGQDYQVACDSTGNSECHVTVNGQRHTAAVARDGDDVFVKLAGRYFKLTAFDPRSLASGGESEGSICAPMPGVVVEVLVAEGDQVAEGDKLMTIESMKLQSAITAPRDGVVARITLKAGAEFNKDDVLAEVADAE